VTFVPDSIPPNAPPPPRTQCGPHDSSNHCDDRWVTSSAVSPSHRMVKSRSRSATGDSNTAGVSCEGQWRSSTRPVISSGSTWRAAAHQSHSTSVDRDRLDRSRCRG